MPTKLSYLLKITSIQHVVIEILFLVFNLSFIPLTIGLKTRLSNAY